MVEALFENGLAHLLGARGSHAALGLVELETGGLEIEAAEIEHPPHVALEIIDNIFVLNFQYLARQYRVPVAHQLHVQAVIAGDVVDTVSELLPRRE